MRDAEPIAGLRAAREVELAARFCAGGFIRGARETGHDWHEIGAALGISSAATTGQTKPSRMLGLSPWLRWGVGAGRYP